jgi:hypothetical protein
VRNVLVGLLWLSVLASLSVYAYRIYRRVTRGPKSVREAAEKEAPVSASAGTTTGSPVETDLDRVLDRAAKQETGASRSSGDATPGRGVTDDAPAPAAPPGARSGLFASTSQPPTTTDDANAPSDETRSTVAAMLSGVSMPCDLVPIVDADAVVNPYRVAFSTHTAPAADVGAAVGDELERLGFALRSVTSNQVEATKDEQRLTVTIHADASTATVADAAAYPNLPPGSVVVEFEV